MFVAIFIIAAGVSALGTMAGFGGGIFVVPIMVMGFGIPIEVAIGVTALSLFPSSLLSTIWNTKKKLIDFKLMWSLEVPTIFGAIVGAKLTKLIPTQPLEITFSVFLLFLAWKMNSKKVKKMGLLGRMVQWLNRQPPVMKASDYKISVWAATFFGAVSGILAGLFGIGGGILKTPVMLNVFHVPVRTATATAICMITFTSLSSGITHWQLGNVELNLLAATAGGFFFGAFLGNWYGVKLQDETLRKLIAGSIALAGTSVLLHAIWLSTH